MTCSIDGCEKPARQRGWCGMHYGRWRRHGDPGPAGRHRVPKGEQPPCSVEGCTDPARSHGLCSSHDYRARTYGTPTGGHYRKITGTDEERFMARVEIQPSGCWHWTGALNSVGYPEFQADKRTLLAHRWSHEHFIGPIPANYEVDHTCHNADPDCAPGPCLHRRCVNPAHLEAVTSGENKRRARERVHA